MTVWSLTLYDQSTGTTYSNFPTESHHKIYGYYLFCRVDTHTFPFKLCGYYLSVVWLNANLYGYYIDFGMIISTAWLNAGTTY
jgi:hypothetical protein